MKYFFPALLALALVSFANVSNAQIKTEGTKTETDSVTGATKTTKYTELKKEEDVTPRHDMIVINPLKFFVFYNLSYYHSLGNNLAFGIGAQMPTTSLVGGAGVSGEIRFYPSKKSLRGFYVAPNISYNHLTSSDVYNFDYSRSNATRDAYSLGVLLGWQWFPGDDFAMGLGIGIDRWFHSGNDNEFDYYTIFGSYSGTKPAFRFDIGYAW